jgi:hypothetical protein
VGVEKRVTSLSVGCLQACGSVECNPALNIDGWGALRL